MSDWTQDERTPEEWTAWARTVAGMAAERDASKAVDALLRECGATVREGDER